MFQTEPPIISTAYLRAQEQLESAWLSAQDPQNPAGAASKSTSENPPIPESQRLFHDRSQPKACSNPPPHTDARPPLHNQIQLPVSSWEPSTSAINMSVDAALNARGDIIDWAFLELDNALRDSFEDFDEDRVCDLLLDSLLDGDAACTVKDLLEELTSAIMRELEALRRTYFYGAGAEDVEWAGACHDNIVDSFNSRQWKILGVFRLTRNAARFARLSPSDHRFLQLRWDYLHLVYRVTCNIGTVRTVRPDPKDMFHTYIWKDEDYFQSRRESDAVLTHAAQGEVGQEECDEGLYDKYAFPELPEDWWRDWKWWVENEAPRKKPTVDFEELMAGASEESEDVWNTAGSVPGD